MKWYVFRYLALLAIGLNCAAGQPITIPGLFNTGVDDSGTVLSLHSVDHHYAVSGVTSVGYVVPEVSNPQLGWYWHSAPSGSAWIGPNTTDDTAHNDPVGVYHDTLT